MPADLHFHSSCSDGKLPVAELAAMIIGCKLEYCALVDHDTVEGLKEIHERLDGSGTTLITGIELTALHRGSEVHVLAYDLDVDAATAVLKERNELVWIQKGEEIKEAVRLFRAAGFEVSDGLALSPKKPVGATVALDVYDNPRNRALLAERHGRLISQREFFDAYQAEGRSCAARRSGVGFDWLVGNFKGVAKDLILAHPFVSVSLFKRPLDEQGIVELLDLGATGVEVYHDNTTEEQIDLLKRLVRDRDLHFTGGSDFHGHEGDTPLGHYGPGLAVPEFKLARYSFGA